jgi:hypothetical protein
MLPLYNLSPPKFTQVWDTDHIYSPRPHTRAIPPNAASGTYFQLLAMGEDRVAETVSSGSVVGSALQL